MSITNQGQQAEKMARLFLRSKGVFDIQQFDWFVKGKSGYYIIEVKHRELFEPPPFLGTGLDVQQINRRMQVFNDIGIRTLLMVFTSDEVFYQWLDTLEKTKHFTTKNEIRIYEISNFVKRDFKGDAINEMV